MNMKRGLVLSMCALTAMVCGARLATAQNSVVVSLDVYYQDPQNIATSGGAWQLLAKVTAGGAQGISGLDTALTSVSTSTSAADLLFRAPNPGFETTYDTKSWFQDQDANATTLDMLFGQVPVAAPGPQHLVYGAGVTGGVSPDRLSASVDTPGGGTQGDVAMTNAVLLAVGRFSAGQTPNFSGTTSANVFTAQGTGTNPPAVGSIVSATVTTQRRSNAGNFSGLANQGTVTGDLNLDKTTAGADLLTLLPNLNKTNQLWADGDINGDHVVAGADLLLLLPKLNQSHPATGAAGVVPEPASAAMAVAAVVGLCSMARRRRAA
jgi:hypothetical protein